MPSDIRLTAILNAVLLATALASCGKSGDKDDCEKLATDDCGEDVSSKRATTGGVPLEQDLPPIPGASLSFASVAWNGYVVSWEAATDDQTSASKLEYQLVGASDTSLLATAQQAAAIAGGDVALPWSAKTLTATVTGRPALETRAFSVLVRDEAGNLALYTPKTVTTLEQPPPVPGTGIVVRSIGSADVEISWGAASSDGDTALTYSVVFAASAAEIDTLTEAEAVGTASGSIWLPVGTTSMTVANAGSGGLSYAAVIVKNSSGGKALYAPASLQP